MKEIESNQRLLDLVEEYKAAGAGASSPVIGHALWVVYDLKWLEKQDLKTLRVGSYLNDMYDSYRIGNKIDQLRMKIAREVNRRAKNEYVRRRNWEKRTGVPVHPSDYGPEKNCTIEELETRDIASWHNCDVEAVPELLRKLRERAKATK